MSTNPQIEMTDFVWKTITASNDKRLGSETWEEEWRRDCLRELGEPVYENGSQFTLHPAALHIPLRRKKPTSFLVDSAVDLFHESVPLEFLIEVFLVMVQSPQHKFQVLTKRAERLLARSPELPWTPNIWMGVSIEGKEYFSRLDNLRACNARVKFLSLEPLLGPLPKLDLKEIDWVIVGGESGPKARPIEVEWVREIRDRCVDSGTLFFFKQWGQLSNNPVKDGPTAKENGGEAKGGRMLDDRTWNEMLDFNLPRINGTSPKHQMLFAKRIGGTTPNYGEAYW